MKTLLIGLLLSSSAFASEFGIGDPVFHVDIFRYVEEVTIKDIQDEKNFILERTNRSGYKTEFKAPAKRLATQDLSQCKGFQEGNEEFVRDLFGGVHKAKILGCFVNSEEYKDQYIVKSKTLNKKENIVVHHRSLISRKDVCVSNENGKFCPGDTLMVKTQGYRFGDVELLSVFDKSEAQEVVVEMPDGKIQLLGKSFILGKL